MTESLRRLLEGRLLLAEECRDLLENSGSADPKTPWKTLVQAAFLHGYVTFLPGMRKTEKGCQCRRCGSGEKALYRSFCGRCGKECPYCEGCLQMGKVRGCSLLIWGRKRERGHRSMPSVPDIPDLTRYLQQEWKLSPAQARASAAGIRFLQDRRGTAGEPSSFLLWAVTGAGKTEMIFPLIDFALRLGEDVLMAAPRRDVVLELAPRLEKQFPDTSLAVLYGGSGQKWRKGRITLSTTHQLIRFRESFDVVIVDEVDAFPYHNNPVLTEAAKRSCRKGGAFVFLSATPPETMVKAARRGTIRHVKVPCRHHGYPLPVPKIICRKTRNGRMSVLVRHIRDSMARGAQCFVFVPRIEMVKDLAEEIGKRLSVTPGAGGTLFQRMFRDVMSRFPAVKKKCREGKEDSVRTGPAISIVEGTSSQDPGRSEKVRQFREGQIRVLVTTTILERGVTIPGSDVFVFEADAGLFDEAALVQMAGRAGRSSEDPYGRVVFMASGRTRAQVRAVRHIRGMNRLARKLGFLKEDRSDVR